MADVRQQQAVKIVDPSTNTEEAAVVNAGLSVGGDEAHSAVDAGNPVKIGGKASATPPAAVSGNDRVDAWFEVNGQMAVFQVTDAGLILAATIPSDGFANTSLRGYPVLDANLLWNGSTWDRQPGSTEHAFIGGNEAHDAADAGNPVKFGGRAQEPEAQPDEVADNDRVDALFDRNGYQRVRGDMDPSFADINDATSGNNTIVAAQAAGKRIAVWSILIVSDGTVDVRWEDGAGGTAFTGQVPLQAREGYAISAGGLVPLFIGSAATLLNLELSAAINVHGFVSYTVVDD